MILMASRITCLTGDLDPEQLRSFNKTKSIMKINRTKATLMCNSPWLNTAETLNSTTLRLLKLLAATATALPRAKRQKETMKEAPSAETIIKAANQSLMFNSPTHKTSHSLTSWPTISSQECNLLKLNKCFRRGSSNTWIRLKTSDSSIPNLTPVSFTMNF